MQSRWFRLFLICLFLLGGGNLFSQTAPLDSLRSALNGLAEDTDKAEVLLQLAEGYIKKQPDSALFFAEALMELAHNMSDISYKSQAFLVLGEYHLYHGEVEMSGVYYEMAEIFFRSLGDSSRLYRAISEQGIRFHYLSNFEAAIRKSLEALRYFERTKDSLRIAYLTNNLGVMYMDNEEMEEALQSYQASFLVKAALKPKPSLSSTLNNLASVFQELGQQDSAIYYGKLAEADNPDAQNLRSAALTARIIGYSYLKKGEYEAAEIYLSRGLTYTQELDYPAALAGTLNEYSQLNLALGKYTKARLQAEEAYAIIKPLKTPRTEVDILEQLGKVAEKQGRFADALAYQQDFHALWDSLFTQERQDEISRLRTQFDTERKEQQLQLSEQKQQVQAGNLRRTQLGLVLTAVIAALLAVLSGVFVYYNRQRKRTNQLLADKNQQLAELNATKDKLFSIVAHDLKNPLSAFRSLTDSLARKWDLLEKGDILPFIQNLNQSSGQLYDLLQNLLQWAISQTGRLSFNPRLLKVDDMLEKAALNLQGVADIQKISLEVEAVSEGLEISTDERLIQTILRNLIANGIKFTPEGGAVNVSAISLNKGVQFTVSDTGIGISPEDQARLFDLQQTVEAAHPQKGTGLGLMLSHELVERVGGAITVESALGQGSTFGVWIPNATL